MTNEERTIFIVTQIAKPNITWEEKVQSIVTQWAKDVSACIDRAFKEAEWRRSMAKDDGAPGSRG